jgi:tRNA modification GTPase
VLRLSGPGLLARADAMLPPGLPRPRAAVRREVLRGNWEGLPGMSAAIALWVMPGPGSATGEDVLELHLPGCQPLLDAAAAALLARGVRRAEPGEFTRRAFLNGRLDLVPAVAALDRVTARHADAARAAAAVLAGALGREAAAARAALTAALVEVEAGLDFEEGDSQDLRPGEIGAHLEAAAAALARGHAGEQRRAEGARPEFRIALRGRPNAGKSALFRALTGADALVADEAGTTRDRLEAVWSAGGTEMPWRLLDGPGSGGDAADPRDAAARARADGDDGGADLVWLCVDGSDPRAPDLALAGADATLIVLTKSELPLRAPLPPAGSGRTIAVSALRRRGFDALAEATARLCAEREQARTARLASATRHAEALATAADAVARAQAWHARGGAQDLVAEELRAALAALADLIGRLAPEDLLDRLFARFCVGK